MALLLLILALLPPLCHDAVATSHVHVPREIHAPTRAIAQLPAVKAGGLADRTNSRNRGGGPSSFHRAPRCESKDADDRKRPAARASAESGNANANANEVSRWQAGGEVVSERTRTGRGRRSPGVSGARANSPFRNRLLVSRHRKSL